MTTDLAPALSRDAVAGDLVVAGPDTPHGNKIACLITNDSVPEEERRWVRDKLVPAYRQWRHDLETVPGNGSVRVERLVELLNRYREFVDIDILFDAPGNYIWRGRGQNKLSQSVIEEWLPFLIDAATIPEIALLPETVEAGPRPAFAGIHFDAHGNLVVLTKDQDFVLGHRSELSHHEDAGDTSTCAAYRPIVAAECKTNVDATMLDSVAQSAQQLKQACQGARAVLLCDWLDGSALSSTGTAIDRAVVLRGPRPATSTRKLWKGTGRRAHRDSYVAWLTSMPVQRVAVDVFVDEVRDAVLVASGTSAQRVDAVGEF